MQLETVKPLIYWQILDTGHEVGCHRQVGGYWHSVEGAWMLAALVQCSARWMTWGWFRQLKEALIHAPAVKLWHPCASHSRNRFHKLACWKSANRCNGVHRGMNKFTKNIMTAVNEILGQYEDDYERSWMHLVIWNWHVLIKAAHPKCETEQATKDQQGKLASRHAIIRKWWLKRSKLVRRM